MPQNLWGSLVLEIQWSWRLGIDFDYWEEAAAVVVGLDLPAAGIDIVDWGLGKFDCHTDRTWALTREGPPSKFQIQYAVNTTQVSNKISSIE